MKQLNVTRGKVAIKEDGGGETTTEHGIIYNEKKNKTEGTGVLHSVGSLEISQSGVPIPFDGQPGDRVLFTKKNGYSVFGGYTIVNQSDVYGIFGEELGSQ